jgi:hypothetical protein
LIKTMGAELLTAACFLVGWALLTYVGAILISVWVIPISTGVLLWALVGAKLIATVLWHGLYSLSREDE